MTRGYWRIFIVVFGLLVVVGGGFLTAYLYQASDQRQDNYNYQPASKPGLVLAMPGQRVPDGYQPNCQNPQSGEDADLCAQWAAVAQVTEANRMASLNLRLAIASLWATIAATIALIWTLIESHQTSRRELRAYLYVDASGIADGTHHPRLPGQEGLVMSAIIVKNLGALPHGTLCIGAPSMWPT